MALGANRAYRGRQPLENLNYSLVFLVRRGVEIRACSRPWRTPAWPDPADPPYVNAAIEIESALKPADLLALLHDTEAELGRERGRRNAPRSLDLDLIDWRGAVTSEPALRLPHPRAHMRAFVLLPLRDIAPTWRHPQNGRTIAQLLAALPEAERRACRPAGGVLCAAA